MSKDLGRKLPRRALVKLDSSIQERSNYAIFLVTTDDSGFPHLAMLSPYQVVATSASRMHAAVHSSSHSAEYLRKSGKGMLVLQTPPSVMYVRCSFVPREVKRLEEKGEDFFDVGVINVAEDYSDMAELVTPLTFDPSKVKDTYTEIFRLVAEASSRESPD